MQCYSIWHSSPDCFPSSPHLCQLGKTGDSLADCGTEPVLQEASLALPARAAEVPPLPSLVALASFGVAMRMFDAELGHSQVAPPADLAAMAPPRATARVCNLPRGVTSGEWKVCLGHPLMQRLVQGGHCREWISYATAAH